MQDQFSIVPSRVQYANEAIVKDRLTSALAQKGFFLQLPWSPVCLYIIHIWTKIHSPWKSLDLLTAQGIWI